MKTLIRKAREWDRRRFKKPDRIRREHSKYSLWDMRDNLEGVFDDGTDDFYLVYYNYLDSLLGRYCEFLAYPRIRTNKVRRFLTSERDRTKYRLEEFPNKRFVSMFLNALSLNDRSEMLDEYRNLTDHVLKEMGGFNIDGWKVRSKIEG